MRLNPGVQTAQSMTRRGLVPDLRVIEGPERRQPWRPPVRILGLLELLRRSSARPLRPA